MNDEASTSVLRRMARAHQPATPEVPITASRAVRLAMTRAAQNAVGLKLSVLSVGEDTLSLDELVEVLDDDLLMMTLMRRGQVGGLVACDYHFTAATSEIQTLGRLRAAVPEARRITGTDMALAEPVLEQALRELEETTPRTALDGWADGFAIGDRIPEVRRVPFDLSDVIYRLIRVSLDLGVEGREGILLLALPLQVQAIRRPAETRPDWDKDFKAAVLKAPARLDAVLHKFQMPLSRATTLEVGQVVPLPGCTVGSVRLVAPDGKVVGRARLGQMAGQLAVRLQDADDTPLSEMPALGGGGGLMAGGGMMGDPGGLLSGPGGGGDFGGFGGGADLGGGEFGGFDGGLDLDGPSDEDGPDAMMPMGQPMELDLDLAED